ncbi:endonuclease/exonuclease/phosphatase family protein [Citricoccus sp. GCM10030269]|uniref:endonuclease/exonuclease/phosphatase family protein n=1 Tax=Citricoccus sp. GCM10030269 TaxID=3273388 RepID=UPI00360973C0
MTATAVLLSAPAATAAAEVHSSSDETRPETTSASETREAPSFDFNDALPENPNLLRQLRWIESGKVPTADAGDLRVATFSAGLSRPNSGQLAEDLSAPGNEQGMRVAEAVQRAAPDVALLTDFDVDGGEAVAQSFRTNYLSVGSGGQEGIDYPYTYVAEVNNGVDTGADLDNDGVIGGPGDAFGPGRFPGQHGMVLFSRYPLDTDNIRTFRELSWDSMPDNAIPDGAYTELEQSVLRLSSSSHWDIPVEVDGQTVHVLAAQPSRADDGAAGEERHHDEMRFWADYIEGDASYIEDDQGRSGGLTEGEKFVLAGDFGPLTGAALNDDEEQHPSGIARLLESGAIEDPEPTSSGAESLVEDAPTATEVVSRKDGDWKLARSDYLLPSSSVSTSDSGVFWPLPGQLGSHLTNANAPGGEPGETNESTPSEHRLVWVDLSLGEAEGDD